MNKAPSFGQEPYLHTTQPSIVRESWIPYRKARTGTRSSKDLEDVASETLETSSSTTIPGDLREQRMVVAIDYGTTFTGVAYAIHDNNRPEISNIRPVTNWGDDMSNDVKIPSVISYSPSSHKGEQQVGASLSPDAVAMVNTKLELEAQDTRLDELDLIIRTLEGTKNLNFEHVKHAQGYPGYTWKSPDDIVTDYLTKVFEHFERATAYLTEVKDNIPVNIIVTTPVKWSYKAKNSTFRAIRNAGFNENAFAHLESYYLITEPAAAALYTARYLKEEEADSLKKGECFVLCDAGGGTVDVVSYKVKEVEPNLELEAMTIPTGAKCGASFIDGKFREWLHDVIEEDRYSALDGRSDGARISAHATEGGKMRQVMRQFEGHKRAFHGASSDMRIDLPDPLHKVSIDGKIEDGELTITNDDMQFFFEDCIDEIIELIQGQLTQVEKKRNRIKSIFLTGGFSESRFLQEELAIALKLRNIRLRRAETSWSAVFQGAVLYGMDIANGKNHSLAIPCPRSYGLARNDTFSKRTHNAQDIYQDPCTNETMAKGHFDWFILKGDLLLAEESREIERVLIWNFPENDQRVCSVPLYEYLDDDIPDRYQTAQEEVNQVAILTTDLSHMGVWRLERCKNMMTGLMYYRVVCTCKFVILGTRMSCELWWNNKLMCETTLENIL